MLQCAEKKWEKKTSHTKNRKRQRKRLNISVTEFIQSSDSLIPTTEFCVWVLKRVAMLGFQSSCWWATLRCINKTKESTHGDVREGGVTEAKGCFTGKRGWSPWTWQSFLYDLCLRCCHCEGVKGFVQDKVSEVSEQTNQDSEHNENKKTAFLWVSSFYFITKFGQHYGITKNKKGKKENHACKQGKVDQGMSWMVVFSWMYSYPSNQTLGIKISFSWVYWCAQSLRGWAAHRIFPLDASFWWETFQMVGFVVPKKARKRVQDHRVEEKWVRRREALLTEWVPAAPEEQPA